MRVFVGVGAALSAGWSGAGVDFAKGEVKEGRGDCFGNWVIVAAGSDDCPFGDWSELLIVDAGNPVGFWLVVDGAGLLFGSDAAESKVEGSAEKFPGGLWRGVED